MKYKGELEQEKYPVYPKYKRTEANPELAMIEGVLANPDLVGGRFNNCPDGWGCRIISDIDTGIHTAGEVKVDDRNVLVYGEEDLRNLRRSVMSMVFQRFALWPHRTVVENAATTLKVRGVGKSDCLAEVLDLRAVGASRAIASLTPPPPPPRNTQRRARARLVHKRNPEHTRTLRARRRAQTPAGADRPHSHRTPRGRAACRPRGPGVHLARPGAGAEAGEREGQCKRRGNRTRVLRDPRLPERRGGILDVPCHPQALLLLQLVRIAPGIWSQTIAFCCSACTDFKIAHVLCRPILNLMQFGGLYEINL